MGCTAFSLSAFLSRRRKFLDADVAQVRAVLDVVLPDEADVADEGLDRRDLEQWGDDEELEVELLEELEAEACGSVGALRGGPMTENGKNTNNNVSYPRLKTGACESSD